VSIASPYESGFEKQMRDYKEGKKKWMDKKGFIRHQGDNSNSVLAKPASNYVNLSPYYPANSVDFRPKNKSKWIGNNNFKV
jgi:hypothetical protein